MQIAILSNVDMKPLRLALGISLTLLIACTQEKPKYDLTNESALSPWHSRTAEQIWEVATAVTDSADGTFIFNQVSLLELDKSRSRLTRILLHNPMEPATEQGVYCAVTEKIFSKYM
jgi:hypothetical protein|tara:strand:- start:5533 stop:5883 length:351 start_codon:yes stop_codon:yes gene_type:complete